MPSIIKNGIEYGLSGDGKIIINVNGEQSGEYNATQTEDTNINLSIPDELKDLTSDSTHRVVTDTQINTWNNKQSKLTADTDYLTPSTARSTYQAKGNYLTSESDPVFSASAAAGIKATDISNWNSKTSNTGTITGIKMNGVSKGTSGVVDLGTVITEHQDISGKADSSSLSAVATSGSYNDLSNKPTIPTGRARNKGVDTSISSRSTSTNLPTSQAVASFVEGKGYKTTDNNTTYTLTQDASDGHKITLTPSTGTATTITIPDNNTTYSFADTYNSSTNKGATVATVTKAIQALDGNLNSTTAGAGKTLTAFSQTDGVVSATFGNISITKSQVSDFPTIPTITDTYSSTSSSGMSGKAVASAISGKADASSLRTVATSGSYNDLSNKPTIPTVNNATLTIQKNGTNVATFTANSSSNQTANITVPTKVSELTNDSNFVSSTDLRTVATSGSYNDLSNKPDLPTKVSDLENDSGFISGGKVLNITAQYQGNNVSFLNNLTNEGYELEDLVQDLKNASAVYCNIYDQRSYNTYPANITKLGTSEYGDFFFEAEAYNDYFNQKICFSVNYYPPEDGSEESYDSYAYIKSSNIDKIVHYDYESNELTDNAETTDLSPIRDAWQVRVLSSDPDADVLVSHSGYEIINNVAYKLFSAFDGSYTYTLKYNISAKSATFTKSNTDIPTDAHINGLIDTKIEEFKLANMQILTNDEIDRILV